MYTVKVPLGLTTKLPPSSKVASVWAVPAVIASELIDRSSVPLHPGPGSGGGEDRPLYMAGRFLCGVAARRRRCVPWT
jgi:hypothetical protein